MTSSPTQAQTDAFDSPWKDILDGWFPDFMAFFFPEAATEIDWSQGFESLDKELAQVVQDAELGRRYADKLLKVRLADGSEEWVLVHIEVQGQPETDFPRRMFVYAYRIYDRYGCEVASFAVLADTRPGWQPSQFQIGRWGTRLGLVFPSVKLLSYVGREAELEGDPNPFATVVLAHLAALATKGDAAARFQRKLALTRRLYERGLSKQQIIDLYRFIDWVLTLPESLELQYTDAVFQIEESLKMPYMSFIERRGHAAGQAAGQVTGASMILRELLEERFGPLPATALARLEAANAEQLRAWARRVVDAGSLDDVLGDAD
jgi:hypothetical protein